MLLWSCSAHAHLTILFCSCCSAHAALLMLLCSQLCSWPVAGPATGPGPHGHGYPVGIKWPFACNFMQQIDIQYWKHLCRHREWISVLIFFLINSSQQTEIWHGSNVCLESKIFVRHGTDVYGSNKHPYYGGLLGFIHGGTNVHFDNSGQCISTI